MKITNMFNTKPNKPCLSAHFLLGPHHVLINELSTFENHLNIYVFCPAFKFSHSIPALQVCL